MFWVLSLCAAFSSCSLSISVKDEKSENKIKSAPCNNGISRPFELTVSAGCSEFLISNSTVHYIHLDRRERKIPNHYITPRSNVKYLLQDDIC